MSGYFTPWDTPGAQTSIKNALASKLIVEQADMAVARFIKLHYFQPMTDAIAVLGPGYKKPSYHDLRCKLLQKNVNGSVDASDVSKTTGLLCGLFDDVVKIVGPQYVVQFITDNTTNYRAVGLMSAGKYKTMYWMTCAGHCMDSIFEDIGNPDKCPKDFQFWDIEEVLKLVRKRKVAKYIYNYTLVLSMMRRDCGRELICPVITHFATNFLSLESLLKSKFPIGKCLLLRNGSQHPKTRAENEVTTRLVHVFERLVQDEYVQNKINMQCEEYRTTSVAWWFQFGNQCRELQCFAIKGLSQTCTATGFEPPREEEDGIYVPHADEGGYNVGVDYYNVGVDYSDSVFGSQ
ncbi:hypothetical protein AMTRI_Chr03g141730 [Amborella trichopoda]